MADDSRPKRDENDQMLELELSIGGIFGKSKNMNESIDDKREKQGNQRRRKREEKMKILVGSGSFGSISNEWLNTKIDVQNDNVLEDGHVQKKEKILENAYSDGQCSSHQGGATDDSKSNSSNSQLDQQMPSTSTASDPIDPSDQPTSSSKQTLLTNKLTDSTVSNPNPIKPNNQSNTRDSSVSNPPSNNPTTSSQKQQEAAFIARMPCVSTTGNGPNGKTVGGFLYRYTKDEVSIVCVCHGRSFSPAGFVEHAGGVEIVHPLKHITIFPTAFT